MTAPGTTAPVCPDCLGQGRVFAGPSSGNSEGSPQPCPKCEGFGTLLPHPCAECAGDGRVRIRRTLSVKIPPGVDNGTRIQFAGEGERGPGGDLYLEVREQPHPIFQRRGDDLHCTVTIPMVAAALGTEVPLETLDGLEDIDIPPGTQSGDKITLNNRGVTHFRRGERGDLFLHVEVRTPTDLSPVQERLLRDLGGLRGGEERPPGHFQPGQQGLVSRLKDAFTG